MRFVLSVLFVLWTLPAFAQCRGENLMHSMPAADRAKLDTAIAKYPYPTGNLWRAVKGNSTIHVMGTFHLSDPRFESYLKPLWSVVESADLILLEADRAAMEQLKTATLNDPTLLFIGDGPTLIDRLPTEEWDRVKNEMSARGIPGFLASKMQPWYVAMMLSIPPCAMAGLAAQNGVDQRIMAQAEANNIPTRALEAYDVVFSALGGDDLEEELDAVRMGLAGANEGDAMIATLTAAYLAGNHRAIWEFSRSQAEGVQTSTDLDGAKMFAEMEAKLLTERNINWIPVILAAANEADSILVAVGAAHLSGTDGVLYLLELAGYGLTRVEGF